MTEIVAIASYNTVWSKGPTFARISSKMEQKSDRYIDLIINMFSVNIQHLQHIASLSMEHKTVVEYRSQGESFVKNFKMIQNDDDHHIIIIMMSMTAC